MGWSLMRFGRFSDGLDGFGTEASGDRSELHHHLACHHGEHRASPAESVPTPPLGLGVDLPRDQIGVPTRRKRATPMVHPSRDGGAEGVAADDFLEAQLLLGAPAARGPSATEMPLERGIDALA